MEPFKIRSFLAEANLSGLGGLASLMGLGLLVYLFAIPTNEKRRLRGKPLNLQIPEPARPHWKGKRVSEMSIRDEEHPDDIKCLCPATGQLLGYIHADQSSDITFKVSAAQQAFEEREWQESQIKDRLAVLSTMLRYIDEHQEDVCQVACRDTGKTMVDAALGEVMVTLEKMAWIVKHAEKALKTSSRPSSASWIMNYKGAQVRYQPLGIVCAMVSWNYPLHNLLGPVAAAIAAGDSIVVKCSEQVAWSSNFFVQIAKKALAAHNFNPDLVQVVTCWPEHADTLTTHPLVKHITFIGSRPVAHKVVEAAAKPLTPVVVELGGKDPLIVLEDYKNLETIASIIMRGTFQSAGQNCIGVERVVIHKSHYDQLVQILESKIRQFRLGSSIDELNGVDMGALIANIHIGRLESLVMDAVKSGATLVYGGKRYTHPKFPLGVYFEPTMLTNVTPEMKIAQEEVFGPILLVLRPAEDVEDCISLANSTQFGLGGSVFGTNKQTLNYVADRLRCGNVAINDFATYHLCQLPFGGVDGSGYGKFGGYEGLRGLCIEKSICYDRVPFVQTSIPRPLDYPIPSMAKAWTMIKSINNLGYSTSMSSRFNAIKNMIYQGIMG